MAGISDEEHREVAERLRELAGVAARVAVHDMLEALGAGGMVTGCAALGNGLLVTPLVDAADVARLADLIDRPACRAVEFERASWHDETGTHRIVEVRCSNCGAEPWEDLESVTPYCPSCGAMVGMGERGGTR